MVDITSLKVRLARLRLASELDDDPRLEDPAKRDLDKKRGRKKQKKAARSKNQDEWDLLDREEEQVGPDYGDYDEPVSSEPDVNYRDYINQGRGIPKKTKKAAQDPYNEYTTNTGGKRKKTNKLTRSDQKRGKKDKEKVRGSYNRTKRQEGSTQDYKGFAEYVKNTGDKRKKKNKLTRSDKKRP